MPDATVDEQVLAARAQWPAIDPDVEAVVMRLDRANRYMLKAATVSLARVGLAHQEFRILKLLVAGPRSHGSLCRELLVSSGAMTNRLDKLEDLGLLQRQPDPHDRRGVLLELTAGGRQRLDAFVDLAAKRERELFEVLDRAEMQQLNGLLAKLLGALQSELGPAPRRQSPPTLRRLLTSRLALEPLRAGHAAEMAVVLGDPDLYRFTGGRPPTVDELRQRYERQLRGPDGRDAWRNWIVRQRAGGAAVGWLQATLRGYERQMAAELAWTIGVAHQRQGYAREAAGAVIVALRDEGVSEIVADIHPDHAASIAVARALGLVATDEWVDDEVRWRAVI